MSRAITEALYGQVETSEDDRVVAPEAPYPQLGERKPGEPPPPREYRRRTRRMNAGTFNGRFRRRVNSFGNRKSNNFYELSKHF